MYDIGRWFNSEFSIPSPLWAAMRSEEIWIPAFHSGVEYTRKIAIFLIQALDYYIKKFKSIPIPTGDRNIVLISRRNRPKTAPEVTVEANVNRQKGISLTMVQRRLKEDGLHGRIAITKPMLRKLNG